MSAPTTEEVRAMLERRRDALPPAMRAEHAMLGLYALPLAEHRDTLAAEVARLRSVADGARQAWADIGLRCDAAEAEVARLKAQAPPLDMSAGHREFLGRYVRMVWMEWAREQPHPKPSWLVPWADLSEADREVDRRIGERVAALAAPLLADREAEVARLREAAAAVVACVGYDATMQRAVDRLASVLAEEAGRG